MAGNTSSSPDINGTVTSLGYNLIGDTNGTTINGTITGNILNPAGGARLAPLGFYGGQTQTHALLSGSPAINAGTSTGAPTADQRGANRVGQTDIGAFELNNSANGGNFVSVLPSGSISQMYSQTLIPETGETSYCVSSGSLPFGLSGIANCPAPLAEAEQFFNLAPSAALAVTGTPTQAGTFNFAVTASDGTNSNVTNYRLQVLAPTAAGVSVSGRVLTNDGRGLRNAIVTMTEPNGNNRSYRTGAFGYFVFEDVEVGQTYIFQVQSKRFTFAPQVVTVNEELTELNFTAEFFSP